MSVARHTAYNLVGTGIPILVSIVTVPLYLHLAGAERFGVLSICWLLLGYFGVFDLGLGRAVSQRMAALRTADAATRSAIFWTGLLLSAAVGAAGTVLLIPAARFGLGAIRFGSPAVAAEVAAAVPWLAATLPVTLVSGVFTGALVGRERFGWVNAVEALSNALTMILPLALAAAWGMTLEKLVIGSLLARLACTALFALACRRAVPVLRPVAPPPGQAGALLRYGGWISVSGFVGPILSLWDRFAVGVVLGAAAVSAYVVPFTLVLRLTLVPAALARALFPRFAAADAREGARLAVAAVRYLAVLMTPLSLLLLLAVGPFLQLWIGRELAVRSMPVACLLVPGIWLNGFALVVLNLLHAQERPGVAARIHLAEILPYLVLLFAGMRLFALAGTALVWTLRTGIDAFLMFRFAGLGLRPLTALAGHGALIALAAAAGLLLPLNAPVQVAALAVLAALGCALAWRDAPPELRGRALALLRRTPAGSPLP
jgi:O-antigen/teichoic acid export membrane protein